MGDDVVAYMSVVKQLHDIVAHFLRSRSDCRRGVPLCNFQFIDKYGSLKATTRVVTEIRGRLPEQLERDISGHEEYPTEVSIERTSKEAMPRPTQLGEAH